MIDFCLTCDVWDWNSGNPPPRRPHQAPCPRTPPLQHNSRPQHFSEEGCISSSIEGLRQSGTRREVTVASEVKARQASSSQEE
ncbi:hypothetical protein E2C01_008633 [Portunus trituberculatus]|uniref:Uncharacterized protein n=1 Tax=Portunus trituberculatus TaxID=210409 RepID=A0A5B7D2C6_PORTR|nr:hypothetical protein [Portunus trituberculatus]